MKNKFIYIFIVSILLNISFINAQELSISRSLPILEEAIDNRSAAMGNTHYSLKSNSSIYSNPIALFIKKGSFELSTNHRFQALPEGVNGSYNNYSISSAFRFYQNAIFLGFRYHSGAEIMLIDENENELKSRNSFEYTADLGYAYKYKNISAYLIAKYIKSYQTSSANAFAFDLGLFYNNDFSIDNLKFEYIIGSKLQNFGTPFKYIKSKKQMALPTNLGFGAELLSNLNKQNSISLALAVDNYLIPQKSKSTRMGLGLEYSWNKVIDLRFGYSFESMHQSKLKEANDKYFSTGLGLHYKSLSLDFSYISAVNKYANPSIMLGLSYSI